MWDRIIDELHAWARSEPEAWAREGWTRAGAAIADPPAFLEWARDHQRWSFVVAEAAAEVCAKPPEAAAWVLHQIIEELLEE